MKTKSILLTAVSLCLSGAMLNAQYIATNGGGTVSNNITALNGPDTIVDFYNYSPFEYGGSVGFPDSSINSFLYQEDGGALSFVTIYSNNTTGNSATAFSSISLSGATAAFSVQDDPPGGADSYSSVGGTSFSATNNWQLNVTDGFAITDVSGFSQLVQSIENSSYSNWLLHSGNDEGPFELSLRTDLVLTPVPEPATIGLIAMAALPALLILRRRLMKKEG